VSDLELVLLTDEHDVADFDRGNETLNRWLAGHALASQRADLAGSYLALTVPRSPGT
jgi:hypothetical protein